MYVSPHLKIGTPLAGITHPAMRQARDNQQAVWECRSPSRARDHPERAP